MAPAKLRLLENHAHWFIDTARFILDRAKELGAAGAPALSVVVYCKVGRHRSARLSAGVVASSTWQVTSSKKEVE